MPYCASYEARHALSIPEWIGFREEHFLIKVSGLAAGDPSAHILCVYAKYVRSVRRTCSVQGPATPY